MMKYLLALVIFATLIGCKSKSAYKYSQDLVTKERSLIPHITSTEDKVAKYGASGQYDSIGILGEAMEKRVQEKIDEINAMKVPDAKGSDDFKSAILKYFNYIKSLYTSYKNFGNAPTDEERQVILTSLQQQVGEKEKVLQEMKTAQQKYADANNFKVMKD